MFNFESWKIILWMCMECWAFCVRNKRNPRLQHALSTLIRVCAIPRTPQHKEGGTGHISCTIWAATSAPCQWAGMISHKTSAISIPENCNKLQSVLLLSLPQMTPISLWLNYLRSCLTQLQQTRKGCLMPYISWCFRKSRVMEAHMTNFINKDWYPHT